MATPEFTIVIPTYNRADLIAKTLDCILAQTFSDFEVIIVDNCSTDETANVVCSYLSDRRFQYILNERNRERAYSRNVGLSRATGRWLTFLDSDDLLAPNCLADAKEFIQKNNVRLFHNKYDLRDAQGNLLYEYDFPPLERSQKYIAEGNFLSCIGVFLSRDLYTRVRFDDNPDLTGTEDWDFFLRVLAVEPLGRINRVNSTIVDHEQRTIKDPKVIESIYRKKLLVVEKVRKNPKLFAVYGRYINRMLAFAHLYAASMNQSNGNRKSTAVELWAAIQFYPAVIFRKRFVAILLRLTTFWR